MGRQIDAGKYWLLKLLEKKQDLHLEILIQRFRARSLTGRRRQESDTKQIL